MEPSTVSIMLGVAGILVMLWGFWPRLKRAMPPPAHDHDLSDLKAGPTSTPWRHTDRCPLCLSEIGHQEYMTDICLSCGQNFKSRRAHHAAIRNVAIGGRWVPDLLVLNQHYTFDGKSWVRFAPPPHKEADGK